MSKIVIGFIAIALAASPAFAEEIKCSVRLSYSDGVNNKSSVFAHDLGSFVTFFKLDRFDFSVEILKGSPWVTVKDTPAGYLAAGKNMAWLDTPNGTAVIECPENTLVH